VEILDEVENVQGLLHTLISVGYVPGGHF